MWNDLLRRVGIGCALLAAVLTALVVTGWQPLSAWDDRVARDLHAHAVVHSGVRESMRVLSDLVWDPWTMRVLAAVAAFLLWWRGDRERALRVALATVGALAVSQGLKVAVGRERPVWSDPVDSAHSAAYPSGHALTATVVCGMLLWLVPRPAPTWAPAAWAVAALSVLGVGFTRLYLGVHWFSDVVAGWLLGTVLVVLATSLRFGGREPVER
ncbi:phosphatase PAP2 family protein [Streptomyces sp. PCS3-D2]|uniref:phosphatase PAP2 family protein n=1 Tax=Streptomyces sp. PCS3-D2 TaxID=1460244 RepID=UPI00044F8D4F|nr:phosphatase PAP2 family protein [Streptomyces sp. PCS3-D2]WKV75510.1 phosphatase PAP2 family protein [Streptomyces sp. PCS3-D2]